MNDILEVELKKKFFNDDYYPYLWNDRYLQIYYGGASSGKSYFIAQKIITEIMALDGYNVMCVRLVNSTNHESTFAQLCQIISEWNLEILFSTNRAVGRESITCNINKNKIIFKGLDSVEKLKSTTFETGVLTKIWVEEASEISEFDYNQLSIRLRGKSKINKSIILSFNPIDIEHWIKKRFIDNRNEDAFIFHSTYKHNKFLEEDDIKKLEALKDIDYYYYTVYCLGEWGKISTARVFHNITSMEFDIAKLNLKNDCHGMDFGFIHASTLMSQGFKEKKLYIYNEIYYKELTNTEFIKQVNESKFNKDNTVIADSAEPDRIKEFKQDGFNISGSKKGKGSLKDGIDFLKNYEIIIHSKNCPNALREFQGYKYRELKDGTVTPDYVELDDDTIAGVRYGTEHLWSKRTMQQKAGSVSRNQLFATR